VLPTSVWLFAEIQNQKGSTSKELYGKRWHNDRESHTDKKAHKLFDINIMQEYIELYRELFATVLTSGHP
jgi:hypothetical protein